LVDHDEFQRYPLDFGQIGHRGTGPASAALGVELLLQRPRSSESSRRWPAIRPALRDHRWDPTPHVFKFAQESERPRAGGNYDMIR
jgi:hypothetical protein